MRSEENTYFFNHNDIVIQDFECARCNFVPESQEEYCSRLCLTIREKYEEILRLHEFLDSRLPLITIKEVRHYALILLHSTHFMQTFGFILSCVSIAGYKTFDLGYSRDKDIQTSYHKIRDAEIIILHYMDLLRSLLADNPDLLDCTDLPEDLFDHCTQTISRVNDARSS